MSDKRFFRLLVGGVAVYVVLWLAFWAAVGFVAVHFIAKWW